MLNVDTESVHVTEYGDDMRCIIVLASKQLGHLDGVWLSRTKAIASSTEENTFLKFLFSQLNDEYLYRYADCIIYCRRTLNRVTLSFEIEHPVIVELD